MTSQATQILIGSLLGGVGGVGGIVLLVLVRLFPRRSVLVPTAAVQTGYRYCPVELRTVAAFLHPDGSATCADHACRAHIPAPEESRRA